MIRRFIYTHEHISQPPPDFPYFKSLISQSGTNTPTINISEQYPSTAQITGITYEGEGIYYIYQNFSTGTTDVVFNNILITSGLYNFIISYPIGGGYNLYLENSISSGYIGLYVGETEDGPYVDGILNNTTLDLTFGSKPRVQGLISMDWDNLAGMSYNCLWVPSITSSVELLWYDDPTYTELYLYDFPAFTDLTIKTVNGSYVIDPSGTDIMVGGVSVNVYYIIVDNYTLLYLNSSENYIPSTLFDIKMT